MDNTVTSTRPLAVATHSVTNQPPPLVEYNLFERDVELIEAISREGAGWAHSPLTEFGQRIGSEEVIRWGFEANEDPPTLQTHDRFGYRRDEVEFHPAWHELMRLSMQYKLHSLPWVEPRPGAHVARAAMLKRGQPERDRAHLPSFDDLCKVAGDSQTAGYRWRMGAADPATAL